MARKTNAYDRVNRQLNWGIRLLGLWLAVASYYFLRQALDYRGLVAEFAEYQFVHFNRYWPTLTFIVPTVLATVPLLLILWLIGMRHRRVAQENHIRVDGYRMMLGRLGRLQNFFAGVALGCLICVAILTFQALTLPDDNYAPRSIVVGSPDALGPPNGRAVLTGSVDLGAAAQFNEDLLLVQRTLYFAPIRSGPNDKSPLRYFVQLRRDDVKGRRFDPISQPPKQVEFERVQRAFIRGIAFTPYLDGMLRRHALPGEIVTLYRYAGYDVDRDNYVLFASNEPIRWRLQMLAGEFLIAAIVAALLSLYFARRRRVVRKMIRTHAEAADVTRDATDPENNP